MGPSRSFRVALGLFFCSGVCALAYETLWVRQLVFSFGISVYAVSAVLAAFMFGLCAGSYLLGRWAARVSNPLRVYAWFELAIAAHALLLYFVLAELLPAFYRFGYRFLPENGLVLNLARFLVTLVLLALPTTLMGGTLPVLSRLLEGRQGSVGSALGWLYGVNTLGAVGGTALAGFWLIKEHGILWSTLAVFLLNVAIALVALWASRTAAPVHGSNGERSPRAAQAAEPRSGSLAAGAAPSRLVLVVLFLSGFTALSYEVIWNRTLLLYTHNSTYAFSTILIVFLLGVASGSLLYARFPPRWTSARALGLLQLGIAAYVWLSFHLIGELPELLEGLTKRLGTRSWSVALLTIFVATAVTVLVPTVLMGMVFPMATALSTPDGRIASSVAGKAYAVLTLGNILGSLLTGFVFIETLGLRNAFAVGIACNLLGGLALLLYRPRSLPRLGTAAALAAGVLALFLWNVGPGVFRGYYEDFGRRQHYGMPLGKLLFYREEAADNVMVYEMRDGKRWLFFSDGRGTAGTPSNEENRRLGHLPMLLHPDPRSVLSICFGVGNTLSAMAAHRPERLVCVELSRGALEAAEFFPTNQDVLDTPGLEVHIEDGRNYLLRNEERFDVIQLEPPELHQAAVVNLYTREFYELARQNLDEGGLLVQWYSTLMPVYEQKMVMRAFLDVFPDASLWQCNYTSLCLTGGRGAVPVTPESLKRRARVEAVASDLLAVAGPEGELDLFAYHLLGPAALREFVGDVPPVTDDRTFVDFSIPRSREAGFGVWIYFTNQAPGPAYREALLENLRFHLELESLGRPAEHLFDLSASPEAEREAFLAALSSAHERRRKGAIAWLRNSTGAAVR